MFSNPRCKSCSPTPCQISGMYAQPWFSAASNMELCGYSDSTTTYNNDVVETDNIV